MYSPACPHLWAFPPPAHRPGCMSSHSPSDTPVTLQQGQCPSPCSPALPGHGPCRACHQQAHVPAWSRPVAIPRDVSDARGCGCPGAARLPRSWLGSGTVPALLPAWGPTASPGPGPTWSCSSHSTLTIVSEGTLPPLWQHFMSYNK